MGHFIDTLRKPGARMISTMCALVTLTYGKVMKLLGGPQYITLPVAMHAREGEGDSSHNYLYDNKGRFCSILEECLLFETILFSALRT